MSLAAQISDDVAAVFLQTDDFGEQVTYIPKTGKTRTITAVISQRDRGTRDERYHKQQANQATLFVARSETTGVADPQLGDAFSLPGDPAGELWDFSEIVDRDAVSFSIRIQKRLILRGGQMRPAAL